jgi:hypothetical protein
MASLQKHIASIRDLSFDEIELISGGDGESPPSGNYTMDSTMYVDSGGNNHQDWVVGDVAQD